MLKRKFSRAGFLGQSILLLVAPGIASFKAVSAGTLHQTVVKTNTLPLLLKAAVDTSIVGITAVGISDSGLHLNQISSNEAASGPVAQLNPNAVPYVTAYVKKNKAALSKMRVKSKPFFPTMDSVFTKYGLPVELKYLAVIESGLHTRAVSRVGAVGLWQFMPATARELGLKVRKGNDERTHHYKSTVAAAKYLRDLYSVYGDWLLVIAAYNSGPVRVNYAIRKSGSRNFWKLQAYLPAETRGHVKRFIGTHYYFEGQAGITTLTKAEAALHLKAVADYKKLKEQEAEAAAPVASTAGTTTATTVAGLPGTANHGPLPEKEMVNAMPHTPQRPTREKK